MEPTVNSTWCLEPETADRTGADKLVRNVLSSWASHMVFVVAGFVLPRTIDRYIGQTELGIWDFAWSLVNYFSIVGLGIGSSVNRYVAKYRAEQDIPGLRTAVSSVFCVQLIAGLAIAGLSLAAARMVPHFFSNQLSRNLESAQHVVSLLGFSLATQMVFDIFRGVISGCHRWDTHNALNAGFYAATALGMVLTLIFGGHLMALSLVYLGGTVLCELTRVWAAYRICPDLSIRLRYFRLAQARSMLHFGIKGFGAFSGNLIIDQCMGILVATQIGPAALAVFSRPSALVRHLDAIINKFAMVLTPTTGALQSVGNARDLRQLLIQSCRIGVFLCLPGVLLLSILADPIIRLWMGPAYQTGLVLPILAAGYVLPISQRSVLTILTGLNMHGKIGLVSSAVSLVVFGLGVIALVLTGWSLDRAAVLPAVSFAVSQGLIHPLYACRKLQISIAHYLKNVFVLPIVCALPFAACLWINRVVLGDRPLVSVILGCATAVLVLGPLYWRYVVPDAKRRELKQALTDRICAH
jgi:O-antigen/teichoic acid export membrane protein